MSAGVDLYLFDIIRRSSISLIYNVYIYNILKTFSIIFNISKIYGYIFDTFYFSPIG